MPKTAAFTAWTPLAIVALRDRLNLSRDELATIIECTEQAIGLWERGTHQPRQIYQSALSRLAHERGAAGFPALKLSAK